jgi:hypothetical protein
MHFANSGPSNWKIDTYGHVTPLKNQSLQKKEDTTYQVSVFVHIVWLWSLLWPKLELTQPHAYTAWCR